MDYARPEVMVFVFLAVAAVALYSYLSIHSFVDGRRREREAYYRNESVRRLAESNGAGAQAAIALLREEERIAYARRLEKIRLGGVAVTAAGLGTMVFLGVANAENHLLGISIGLIPFLIGVALLIYAFLLAERPQGDPTQAL
jgi:hypothetical protein